MFPLATPLIAGPGAISAAILLVTDPPGELVEECRGDRGRADGRAANLPAGTHLDPGAKVAGRKERPAGGDAGDGRAAGGTRHAGPVRRHQGQRDAAVTRRGARLAVRHPLADGCRRS